MSVKKKMKKGYLSKSQKETREFAKFLQICEFSF